MINSRLSVDKLVVLQFIMQIQKLEL